MADLLLGDCLEVLRTMPDNSVDAVVTDPPYGLAFMGKRWDYDVPSVEVWVEVLRVLKPGGHLLAFAGTRTQHRMACRIEDAGFEIRDMLAWVYGSGFPKSLDVSKAIDRAAGAEREVVATRTVQDIRGNKYNSATETMEYNITAPATPAAQQWEGWGTALKPALEPVTMARKPFPGTVAANVLEHGTGAINVDGCRVGGEPSPSVQRRGNTAPGASIGATGWETPARPASYNEQRPGEALGRWPANLIHDGSDEVVALFPETVGKVGMIGNTGGNNRIYGKLGHQEDRQPGTTDYGSAARFFKQCKGYTEVWPNLLPEPANTAGNSSSLQRQSVASALSDAATWALPVGNCKSVSLAPSTSATANELRQLSESVITAIQSIAPRFWHEFEPARLTLTLSHANVAVTREQTGTTTITASHWKSDGSAEPVTFNITATNTEAGDRVSAPRAYYTTKATTAERQGVTHPTVKPLDLMAYLCRLVTPPGGTVLDPFMGSGTTIKAAIGEGFHAIGIERDPAYFAMAEHRLNGAQLGLALEVA
jgi:DNA modification methylase